MKIKIDLRHAFALGAWAISPLFLGWHFALVVLACVAGATPLFALYYYLRRNVPKWAQAKAKAINEARDSAFLRENRARIMEELREGSELCCYYTTQYNTEPIYELSTDYPPLHAQCRLGMQIDMPSDMALRLLAAFCRERLWLLHNVLERDFLCEVGRAMFTLMYPRTQLVEPVRDDGEEEEGEEGEETETEGDDTL